MFDHKLQSYLSKETLAFNNRNNIIMGYAICSLCTEEGALRSESQKLKSHKIYK